MVRDVIQSFWVIKFHQAQTAIKNSHGARLVVPVKPSVVALDCQGVSKLIKAQGAYEVDPC